MMTSRQPGLLECALEGPFGAMPLVSVPYAVANALLPGLPLQKGTTDARGRFRFPLPPEGPPLIVVTYLGTDGQAFHSERFEQAGEATRAIRLTVGQWLRMGRSAAGRAPAPPAAGSSPYADAARELESRAQARGVSVKQAADRCRRAAYELDVLTGALDRHLGGDAAGTGDLLKAIGRLATAGPAAHASFGPGFADAYARAVAVGRGNPGLGHQALQALFSIQRQTAPVLEAIGHGDGLPPELVDPVDGLGGDGHPGGPIAPGDDHGHGGYVATACEQLLSEDFERAIGHHVALGGASHGHAAPSVSILSLSPDHEVADGNRVVTMEVLSSADLLDPAHPGGVAVSFPTAGGRVEVEGTVVATEPRPHGGAFHRIRVAPPLRTVEGIVQVQGMPEECDVHGAADLEMPDPEVTRCLGGEPARPVPGAEPTCRARPINWMGGKPDVHFGWANGHAVEPSDVRLCAAGGGTWLSPQLLPADDPHPGHTVDPGSTGHALLHDHAMQMGETMCLIDHEGACDIRHESVVRVVEADEVLDVFVMATNAPEDGISLFARHLPAAEAGPADVEVEGTYYHCHWTPAPSSEWLTLGRVPHADHWTRLSLWPETLGLVTESTLTLVKGTARNAFPGHGARVLEVMRVVAPARVESVWLEPPAQPKKPAETFTIKARIALPTFAGTGATLEVGARVGEHQFGGRQAVHVQGKQPIEVAFSGRLWPGDVAGRQPVTVDVRYRLEGPSAPAALRYRGFMDGIGGSTTVEVESRARRDIWSITPERRRELQRIIHVYAITNEMWVHHARFHAAPYFVDAGNITSGSVWFWWHREYIEGLERFIAERDTPMLEEFVPLPSWDPHRGIPPEFLVDPPPLSGQRNDPLRDPQPYLNPRDREPFEGTALDEFNSLDALGWCLQMGYHLGPHFQSLGNLQYAERSARDYIFWLYHAHIDEFAVEWDRRQTLLRGNERSTPRCLGQPLDAAVKTLALNGFVVGTVTANATIPNATELVTGQNPDAYTPNVKGSAVDLTTSPFLPEKTRVPWLVGQERGPAESRLTALGLRPVIGNEPHLKPGQRHRVAWQFPPPNALVPPGSNVTLNLVASWF